LLVKRLFLVTDKFKSVIAVHEHLVVDEVEAVFVAGD
jgi:hypothetical protein